MSLNTNTMFIRKVIILVLCCTFVFGSLTCNAKTAKKALLIGISDYPECKYDSQSSWSKIHGTNDVELIEKTLKKQGFNITKLLNSNATALKIRKSFQRFLAKISKGDIVYVHFSGHGQPVEDLSGDEDDGWDEAIIPYDAMQVYKQGIYEGVNHILDDELNMFVEKARKKTGPSGIVYLVVDACHAGSSYRSETEESDEYVRGSKRGFSFKGKEYIPRIDKRSKIRLPKSQLKSDVCVLEACRAYQSNSEIKENNKHYGPLSFYINKVLNNLPLGQNLEWIENVISLMNKDKRLIRQNAVIEVSR